MKLRESNLNHHENPISKARIQMIQRLSNLPDLPTPCGLGSAWCGCKWTVVSIVEVSPFGFTFEPSWIGSSLSAARFFNKKRPSSPIQKGMSVVRKTIPIPIQKGMFVVRKSAKLCAPENVADPSRNCSGIFILKLKSCKRHDLQF